MGFLKVYKSFNFKDGELYSHTVLGGIFKINYKRDIWNRTSKVVKELGYGFCVFENLNGLTVFTGQRRSDSKTKIFECLANGIQKEMPPLRDFWAIDRIEDINEFLALSVFNQKWPKGTLMTHSLKLIKEIK